MENILSIDEVKSKLEKKEQFNFIVDRDYNFVWCNNIEQYKKEDFFELVDYVRNVTRLSEKKSGCFTDQYKELKFAYTIFKITINDTVYYVIAIDDTVKNVDARFEISLGRNFPYSQAIVRQSIFAIANCTNSLSKINIYKNGEETELFNLIMKNNFIINKQVLVLNELYKYSLNDFTDVLINLKSYAAEIKENLKKELDFDLICKFSSNTSLCVFCDSQKFFCTLLCIINLLIPDSSSIKKQVGFEISKDKDYACVAVTTATYDISKYLDLADFYYYDNYSEINSFFFHLVYLFCTKYHCRLYYNKELYVIKIPIATNTPKLTFNSLESDYCDSSYSPAHVFLNDITGYNYFK